LELNGRRALAASFALATLLVALMLYNAAPQVNAVPSNDHGCYCHNSGIGVWFNGTGFAEFSTISVAPGGSFVLNATTDNIAATGVVPGVQEWMANMTDTGNFTIKPQMVTDNSPQDLNPGKGNITAMYTITAPQSPGSFTLTFYAEGTTVQVSVDVGSQSATTTSSVNGTATMPTGNSTTTTAVIATSTSSSSAGPSVTYYSVELAVIVIGFGLLVILAVRRYPRS
jgi:hypothetical protein